MEKVILLITIYFYIFSKFRIIKLALMDNIYQKVYQLQVILYLKK